MPNVATNFATNSSIHPTMGAGASGGFQASSAGDLLQEDGTSFFVLENASGIIILQ
jgi:hypothetical protein